MRGFALAVASSLALFSCVEAVSIDRFGAIPNNTTYEAAIRNGKALYFAMTVTDHNASSEDRTIVVPANNVYTILPYKPFIGLHNMTLRLDGTLNAFPGDIFLWPNHTSDGRARNVLEFEGCSDITLTGNGTIQGNGYRWWVYVLKTGNDNRPHLLRMISCIRTVFEGWTMLDSPMYHVKWVDMLHGLVQHITIQVDVFGQKQLLKSHGFLSEWGWPTFPLNTDGIDVRGRHIVVRKCHVENFDDSLCVKPMNGGGNLTQCSEDILFEDSTIHYGVGASVGSVGPSTLVSCVRNTTFRNLHFKTPLKAIYVKPNPGDHGSGIVDSITYENITVKEALWWTIWVSTQQQHQPGHGADTGCSFFYPLPGTKCPTQPLVPVTRLTIKNLHSEGAWLSPGILRCSEKGPCTGWHLENINITSVTGFPFGKAHFLCQAIEGATWLNSNINCTNKTWGG